MIIFLYALAFAIIWVWLIDKLVEDFGDGPKAPKTCEREIVTNK